MLLHVAVTPALAIAPESSVCIVVDVLRATTSITVMIAGGCQDIVLCETVDAATEIGRRESRLLCGERGGLRPEHFDYGNSPSQLAAIGAAGRAVAFATSNGTRALQLAGRSPLVLAGCLRNASAVAGFALSEAVARGLSLQVVCSGRDYGRAFALDDVYCAGCITDRVLAAADPSAAPVLTDGAAAARMLYRGSLSGGTSPRDALLAALRETESGRGLARLGLGSDVDYCAQVDASDVVPVAVARSGRVTVERASLP